jgi:hypothetical protein
MCSLERINILLHGLFSVFEEFKIPTRNDLHSRLFYPQKLKNILCREICGVDEAYVLLYLFISYIFRT